MLDESKIRGGKKRIESLLKSGDIVKGDKCKYVDFFLVNSRNSFDFATLLFKVSTNEDFRRTTGFPDFNGFLWTINASYYSMFYLVRALLETQGIRIKTDYSVHLATFDALIYYFYANGKIEKSLIEEFQEAGAEVAETLGKERAKELIGDYFNEKEKRGRFTYEIGEIALKNKAQTSLDRAKRFNEAIRKIIGK